MARRPINTALWRHECGTVDSSGKNYPLIPVVKIATPWRSLCYFAYPRTCSLRVAASPRTCKIQYDYTANIIRGVRASGQFDSYFILISFLLINVKTVL